MASRMRSARRRLRKELLRCIESGRGDRPTLHRVAREIMGREVGVEEVMDDFYGSEVSNATQQLRIAGQTESVDGQWLHTDCLTNAHVDSIAVRRLKRLRGELKAQLRLAHDHGRIEEATTISRWLNMVGTELLNRDAVAEPEAVTA